MALAQSFLDESATFFANGSQDLYLYGSKPYWGQTFNLSASFEAQRKQVQLTPIHKLWVQLDLGHTKFIVCVVRGIYGHESLVELNQAI